jgi:hypothetical protein
MADGGQAEQDPVLRLERAQRFIDVVAGDDGPARGAHLAAAGCFSS